MSFGSFRSFVQCRDFSTYEVADFDADYGLVIRKAAYLTDGDRMLTEERSAYDDKNRLRSTAYLDGTFVINAYSCCRLLWRSDRDGRKVLRSAVTGYDTLYYADEDVWLAGLSTNGGYRVTQHFFDGIGRETNTLTYVGLVPGEANDWHASQGKVLSCVTTAYPEGGDNFSVRTDERGAVTVSRTEAFGNAVETGEAVFINGVRVSATKNRAVFGGGSSTRREWGERDWTEERHFTEYAADGRSLEYSVTESPDCGVVTNSVVVYDLLGRASAVETPLGVTSNSYDGASSRVLHSFLTAGCVNRETVSIYNEYGEQVGTVIDGITNRTDVSYDFLSNECRKVTTTMTVGPETNGWAVVREQLTGLSNGLRSWTMEETSMGDSDEIIASFDDATDVLMETTISRRNGVSTQRSYGGNVLSAQNIPGSTANYYDAFGRVVRTEKAKGCSDVFEESRESIYNGIGDVIAIHTRTATNEIAEAYSYDAFGRRTSVVNALGELTETSYDANGSIVSVSGATYPVRYEYDSQGRRTAMLMTENGEDWIRTRWIYDAATGLCAAKVYADGSAVHHSYTPDGLPETTVYPSGRWITNLYDARRQLAGTTSSDGMRNTVYVRDAYGRSSKSCSHGWGVLYCLSYSTYVAIVNSTSLAEHTFQPSRTMKNKRTTLDSGGRDMVPFLEVLSDLIGRGVEIRLIHAKEPGPNFRGDFDRYPRLFTQMERVLCPRVHFECIIVDGTFAWFGSANLTGAGMGAKSERKRNFENGIITDDAALIAPLEEQFDTVWRGDFCKDCGRRDFCPDPVIP